MTFSQDHSHPQTSRRALLLPPSQDTAWRFVGPFEWDSDEMLTLIRDLAGT